MKFAKTDLKNTTVILKRLVKDKKQGRVIFQTKGDNILHIEAKNEDESLISYHKIDLIDEEPQEFGFHVNPYEIDGILKTKEKEIEFKVNQKSITQVGTKNNIKVEPFDGDIEYKFDEVSFVNFEDSKNFIEILKETNSAIKKSKDLNTSYMKITSEKALAAEEKQVHLFRIAEAFPFKGGYVHKDIVSVLSSSLKGDLRHAMYDKMLLIADKKGYYMVKFEKNVIFPNFRAMDVLKEQVTFTVDANEFNETLKNYKSKVKEIEVEQINEKTIQLDPRHEEFEKLEVEINEITGEFGKVVFEAEVLKNFFKGYDEKVKVEQQQFKNVFGEEGYLWKIYTTGKSTMSAGIGEPPYEFIELAFKEGNITQVEKIVALYKEPDWATIQKYYKEKKLSELEEKLKTGA